MVSQIMYILYINKTVLQMETTNHLSDCTEASPVRDYAVRESRVGKGLHKNKNICYFFI